MIIFVIVIALGAIFFIPMIDLSNNMDLLRREYNTMTWTNVKYLDTK